MLSRPILPEAPEVPIAEHYRLIEVNGTCNLSFDYDRKAVPDDDLMWASFSKLVRSYEEQFFMRTANLYFDNQSVRNRARILILGFNQDDREKIEKLFQGSIRHEYPSSIVYQVGAICSR